MPGDVHDHSHTVLINQAKSPATLPMLIGGTWRVPIESYEVDDPYRGEVTALADRPSTADLDDALAADWP
jgi:hypothetical protein